MQTRECTDLAEAHHASDATKHSHVHAIELLQGPSCNDRPHLNMEEEPREDEGASEGEPSLPRQLAIPKNSDGDRRICSHGRASATMNIPVGATIVAEHTAEVLVLPDNSQRPGSCRVGERDAIAICMQPFLEGDRSLPTKLKNNFGFAFVEVDVEAQLIENFAEGFQSEANGHSQSV